jgi:methyltransferase (TIGR00027 family)
VKEEQVSGTALLIGASLVLMHDNPLYPGAISASSAHLADRVLQKHSWSSRIVSKILRQRWFRWFAQLVERLTVPGILRHYAMRKKCIARLATEAVESGITQVVVLGAGFDGLGPDLQRNFPDVRVWEIDHPATQQSKQAALDHIDPNRFRLVPADLFNSDLTMLLSNAAGFDQNQPTFWIAEGLLMYFPDQIVSRIMRQTMALSCASSRFAFTFMQRQPGERIRFQEQTRLVDWWLRVRGEPFQWGI